MALKTSDKQTKQIYDYMVKHGSITALDAVKLGCYRLSARIWELKNNEGIRIVSSIERVEKADGTKTNVARYSLVR